MKWLLLLLPITCAAVTQQEAADALARMAADRAAIQAILDGMAPDDALVTQFVQEATDPGAPTEPPPDPVPVGGLSCPDQPTAGNNNYSSWQCAMAASPALDGVGAHDWKFGVGTNPRTVGLSQLVLQFHPSGGGNSYVNSVVTAEGNVEVRTQDGEPYGCREAWVSSDCGGLPVENWAGRRAAAALDYVAARWSGEIDPGDGLVLTGISMGGTGAWMQALLLPQPWRDRVVAAIGRRGVSLIEDVLPLAPHSGPDSAYWDASRLRLQAYDLAARGVYMVGDFGMLDTISPWNPAAAVLLETARVPHCLIVHGGGHANPAPDDVQRCDVQRVRLDRPVPAFSASSGDVDCSTGGRCHQNLGLGWNVDGSSDDAVHTAIPIRYLPPYVGAYLPPMPATIGVDLTVRRAALTPGAVVSWSYAGQSGVATVDADGTVTVALVMESGSTYQNLILAK